MVDLSKLSPTQVAQLKAANPTIAGASGGINSGFGKALNAAMKADPKLNSTISASFAPQTVATPTAAPAYDPEAFGGISKDQLQQWAWKNGIIPQGQEIAGGGAVMKALQGNKDLQDNYLNHLVDLDIERQKADPSYGALAKAPYKEFVGFGAATGKAAPTFTPYSPSDLTQDPGYQFRLDEGNKALDRASAARGGFYSGGALKEAAQYNSDMASQEFGAANARNVQNFQTAENAYTDNFNRYNTNFNMGYGQAKGDSDSLYNRLAGLTNTGMGATNTAVNANQNNATAQGEIAGQVGQVKAAGALDTANNFDSILRRSFGSSYGR